MYEVNAARAGRVLAIGAEESPLLCIDDFSAVPADLLNAARDAHYIDVGPLYPGVRAPAPSAYVESLLRAIGPAVESAFGASPGSDLELCAFSMVTMSPTALKPAQRIPHFDGVELERFAFIHYLCAPHFGGTSFYRHRSTRFESITARRLTAYRAALEAELAAEPPAARYISGSTAAFEQIHSVPAVYNRLIVYRGNVLHSGDLPPDLVLLEDPRLGRLTVNGFGFLRG